MRSIYRFTSFFTNKRFFSLADDLVILLKEVDQEIPPWLAACATEQKDVRSRYKFGGRDFRKSGGFQQQADEPQYASGGAGEEW